MLIVHQLPTKECWYRPSGNPTCHRCRPTCGTWSFSEASGPGTLLWSDLAIPNLTGLDTLELWTVTSCITLPSLCSSVESMPGRAGTPPISLRRPVEGSMRLFLKKPVIIFRTSPISSLRILGTRTSPSCSTRTPLSPILLFLPSMKPPQAKIPGAWFYSSFKACCAAPSLAGTPTVTFLLSTHSQCRGQ